MTSFAGFGLARARHDVPVLWRRDPRFKTFRVEYQVRRPLGTTAAARSVLPSLLLQGTMRHPDRPSIARRMEELYGAAVYPGSAKRGAGHTLRLTLDAVSGAFLPDHPDQLRQGLAFLAEQLTMPLLAPSGDAFPEAVFELERREAIAALRALADDKGTWAHVQAMRFACEGEVIGIPEFGSIEDLVAMQARDPETARRDFLERGRVHVVAVGAIPESESELVAHVDDLLADLPRAAGEPVPRVGAIERRPVRRRVETSPGTQQAKLVMVFRLPEPSPDADEAQAELAARRMFDQIFGGGAQSRLFKEVREKRSLAYYASSTLDRHTNLLLVQVGCDPDKLAAVEEETVLQLGELARGAFEDQEIAVALAQIGSRLTRISDSLASQAMFVGEQWLHDDDRTPDDLRVEYTAVTRELIRKVAGSVWLDAVYALVPEDSEAAKDAVAKGGAA
jgi:predicted Zn-dependent peptidase